MSFTDLSIAQKIIEHVSTQLRLLDPSQQPVNDYCGAAWADAPHRWWTVLNRGCSYKDLLSSLYEQIPKGRLIMAVYGGIQPAPLVVETTPLNLAGCPSKDDVVKIHSNGSMQAFWMLVKNLEKPVIVGVLCPEDADPPEDVVQLRKDIVNASDTYEEIKEEEDVAYYADPDHEGKERRHGKIKERVKLRNFPTTKKAADRVLDTIVRRIIRQQRLHCVVLTKVQQRFPDYQPPVTDQESVLYYVDEYRKWMADKSRPNEDTEKAPDAESRAQGAANGNFS